MPKQWMEIEKRSDNNWRRKTNINGGLDEEVKFLHDAIQFWVARAAAIKGMTVQDYWDDLFNLRELPAISEAEVLKTIEALSKSSNGS